MFSYKWYSFNRLICLRCYRSLSDPYAAHLSSSVLIRMSKLWQLFSIAWTPNTKATQVLHSMSISCVERHPDEVCKTSGRNGENLRELARLQAQYRRNNRTAQAISFGPFLEIDSEGQCDQMRSTWFRLSFYSHSIPAVSDISLSHWLNRPGHLECISSVCVVSAWCWDQFHPIILIVNKSLRYGRRRCMLW